MRIRNAFSVAFASILLVGCGAVPPKLIYGKNQNEGANATTVDQPGYLFRHRRSIIKLDLTQADASSPYQFHATPLPAELDSNQKYTPLYYVGGIDNAISTTHLLITYVPNTKFVDEIKITTQDNLAETVKILGETAKTAAEIAPFIAFEHRIDLGQLGAPPKKKAPYDFHETLVDPTAQPADKWQADPMNKGFCTRMESITSESNLTLSEFIAKSKDSTHRSFPVPACTTATIYIGDDRKANSSCSNPNIVGTFRVTFADSFFVTPIVLPSSGSLKMDPVCGASVTLADKEDRNALLNALKEGATQAKDIYTAWKKAKEDQEKAKLAGGK